MIYRIFTPNPVLSEVVEHYWYSKIELKESIIQDYPTPLLQGLTFNFKEQEEEHSFQNQNLKLYKRAYIFGQPISPRVVTTNKKGIDILGVKFKPLGISKITGINMEYFSDKIVAADDIWGAEFESLCDEMQSSHTLEETFAVLESFLLKKYIANPVPQRLLNSQKAIHLIHHYKGMLDIKSLQNLTNTSRKTLERSFLHTLGIHPKLYSRIVRYNAVKSLFDQKTNPNNLAKIGLELGYYDSSHFIAEFKYFSGITPLQYLKA